MTETAEVAPVPAEQAAAEPQTVFATLKEAVASVKANEDVRMYRVIQGQGAVKRTKIVVTTSKPAAALAVIGEENVELVTGKEKYNAALEALMEAKAGQ